MRIFTGRHVHAGTTFRNKNMILPNLITILGLLSGLYSIILSFHGRFVAASIALLIAALFDAMDGKVARLVKGTSEFGVQLDSLCDLVSFGVAPAMLIYLSALGTFGRLGIMAIFLYVACGALRLARFNVQAGKIDTVYFVGLPIPAAAAFIASSVIFLNYFDFRIDRNVLGVFFLISIYGLGILMVSTVPFYSFKKIKYVKEKPFNALVIIIAILAIVLFNFEIMFFTSICLYIFISLLLALWKFIKKGGTPPGELPAVKE